MSNVEDVRQKHLKLAEKLFQKEYGLFIDGAWEQSSSGETIDMINPSTGDCLAKIQSANAADAKRAVEAAAKAFPAWSRTSRSQRQEIIYEMGRRLKARAEDCVCLTRGSCGPCNSFRKNSLRACVKILLCFKNSYR